MARMSSEPGGVIMHGLHGEFLWASLTMLDEPAQQRASPNMEPARHTLKVSELYPIKPK